MSGEIWVPNKRVVQDPGEGLHRLYACMVGFKDSANWPMMGCHCGTNSRCQRGCEKSDEAG